LAIPPANEDRKPLLFDLLKDPEEENNVYAQHKNKVVPKLKKLMEKGWKSALPEKYH
jgi:hypothetical protein